MEPIGRNGKGKYASNGSQEIALQGIVDDESVNAIYEIIIYMNVVKLNVPFRKMYFH